MKRDYFNVLQSIREGNYIWTVCDLETQLWKIIHSCSLESKWSFSVHVLSLLLQDSEIWAIRVKQLIGLLACLTWFVQYCLLLDTDFSQLFRKSRESNTAVKLCSAELKWLDIVRAFKRLNVVTLVLSPRPPQILLNSLEKISVLLYVLVCLIHWIWNMVIYFYYFIGTFDDSDLLDGNSPRGGSDGSGSNGKIGGCASYCFYGYLSFWLKLAHKVVRHAPICNAFGSSIWNFRAYFWVQKLHVLSLPKKTPKYLRGKTGLEQKFSVIFIVTLRKMASKTEIWMQYLLQNSPWI